MNDQEAIEQDFTHYAEMYGVDGYYKEDGCTFEAKTWFGNIILDFFIWVEQVFNINHDGFPIKIKGEIRP